MIARLKDLFRGRDGEWILSLSTPSDPRETFDKLHDKSVDVEIKQHRNKRSLDANAYLWVLIGKLAEQQNISKNEVYRKEIVEHGAYQIHCVPNDKVLEYCEEWSELGLGFQYETFNSKIDGCTNVMFYKGSSCYDSKQMAKLLDGVIHECEANGIGTITPEEEDRLIRDWGKKRKENENEQ